MIILAIETSCDDTSVAIVKVTGTKNPRFSVLANEISSQIKLHSPYGGVVPGLASREHLKNLPLVFETALKKAKIQAKDIDYITTTEGPGLVIALLIGLNFARALAYSLNKKIIPVHHISGHIYSNWLANKKIDFPVLNLTVSGGHTELILMKDHGKFKVIGSTRDDAAGEAFDKVAKLLGLGYPGGPIISAYAKKHGSNAELTRKERGTARKKNKNDQHGSAFQLPRPMINSKDFDFSFSGLKTAVMYLVKDIPKITEEIKQEICAEFQQAVIDVLIHKTIKAAKKENVRYILLAGGVSANNELRRQLAEAAKKEGFNFLVPEKIYSTDNAAMIAVSAYFNQKNAQSWEKLDANPNLKLK